MTRQEILAQIKRYFDIEELVCDHVFAKWGESAWMFLDTDYLHCLLIIRRDILKCAMWCNSNSAHQRGLRCNRCQLVREKNVPYLSGHILGRAGDFTVTGYKAEKAREMIKANANLLPCPIRMERGVSWLHFDTYNMPGYAGKVYEFDA